jgi:hypothetical protein
MLSLAQLSSRLDAPLEQLVNIQNGGELSLYLNQVLVAPENSLL